MTILNRSSGLSCSTSLYDVRGSGFIIFSYALSVVIRCLEIHLLVEVAHLDTLESQAPRRLIFEAAWTLIDPSGRR